MVIRITTPSRKKVFRFVLPVISNSLSHAIFYAQSHPGASSSPPFGDCGFSQTGRTTTVGTRMSPWSRPPQFLPSNSRFPLRLKWYRMSGKEEQVRLEPHLLVLAIKDLHGTSKSYSHRTG